MAIVKQAAVRPPTNYGTVIRLGGKKGGGAELKIKKSKKDLNGIFSKRWTRGTKGQTTGKEGGSTGRETVARSKGQKQKNGKK